MCAASNDLNLLDYAVWSSLQEMVHHCRSFKSRTNKKAQLSLTNPRDACEKFARFT